MGDNSKRVIKDTLKFLKPFFSRTSKLISIKLDTNHRWVKGILNCSIKGPVPLQRGNNRKNGAGSFKNLLKRTTEPEYM
jgi:hypothetical protein